MSSSSPAAPPPVLPDNAYLAGLMHSLSTLTLERLAEGAANAPHEPCAQKAFLWGSLVAALMGLHRYKQGGSPLRASRSGLLAFGFTFLSQFYVCRQNAFDSKVAMREFMARQQLGAAASGAPSPSGGGDILR